MQEQQPVPPGRRQPTLLTAAWLLAIAVVALLGVAVAHHLNSGQPSMAGMHSMSDALYRAGGEPHGPLLSSRLFTTWQLDAVALAVLVLLATGYLTAAMLANRQTEEHAWPARYTLSFLAGLVVCGLATNSSIAVYDMSLFSAHMIGHLMLVMLAPALLTAGRPLTLLLRANTGRRRERIATVLTGRVVSLLTAPPVALAGYTVVIVATHLTGLMDVIMRHTWAGQLEHLVYLLLGCQFFVVVIGDAPIRWRLPAPSRLFMLALSMAVDTFTGIVLLQSTVAIAMTPPPGADVNPLTDTRTGGAIMWFGGDGIMAVIMVAIAIGWVHGSANRQVDSAGWLEQARRASFAAHAGSQTGSQTGGQAEPEDADTQSAASDDDFDDSELRLRQYNDWLRRLDSQSP
ncbi:MAG TPA: cytochrome c oxidase assembly protein [Jatrophihabitans sp.]|nr:cytochrome c oxidase assembly protein [Jatrophihabitans sp.]